jgi:hypothetical protein
MIRFDRHRRLLEGRKKSAWLLIAYHLLATWKMIPRICAAVVPSLKDSRTSEAVSAIVVTWALAFVTVILRFASRKVSTTKFGMDDYLIFASMVSRSL